LPGEEYSTLLKIEYYEKGKTKIKKLQKYNRNVSDRNRYMFKR